MQSATLFGINHVNFVYNFRSLITQCCCMHSPGSIAHGRLHKPRMPFEHYWPIYYNNNSLLINFKHLPINPFFFLSSFLFGLMYMYVTIMHTHVNVLILGLRGRCLKFMSRLLLEVGTCSTASSRVPQDCKKIQFWSGLFSFSKTNVERLVGVQCAWRSGFNSPRKMGYNWDLSAKLTKYLNCNNKYNWHQSQILRASLAFFAVSKTEMAAQVNLIVYNFTLVHSATTFKNFTYKFQDFQGPVTCGNPVYQHDVSDYSPKITTYQHYMFIWQFSTQLRSNLYEHLQQEWRSHV